MGVASASIALEALTKLHNYFIQVCNFLKKEERKPILQYLVDRKSSFSLYIIEHVGLEIKF